jgi:hypothetical protein
VKPKVVGDEQSEEAGENLVACLILLVGGTFVVGKGKKPVRDLY